MTHLTDPDAGRAIARYLGVTLREVETGRDERPAIDGTAPLGPHARGRVGSVRAGLLLTMLDFAGGLCGGLAALPRWVVSTNLVAHLVPGEARGDVHLRARVVRAGRNAVVTTVDARDGTGRILAEGVLTSAALEPAGGPPAHLRPLVLDAPAPPTDAPAPDEFFGIRPVDEWTVALDLVDRVRNPWGILHGGAIAMLVDAGTALVLGDAAEITSVVLHFLSPGRVGPVTASARHIGSRPDGELLRIEVRDDGADGRLLSVAIVTASAGRPQEGGRGS